MAKKKKRADKRRIEPLPAPQKKIAGEIPEKRTRRDNSSLFVILGRLLFFLFVFWFWGFRYADFLYMSQNFDIFIWDEFFFRENITRLAGLLFWMTSFCVQFFYVPLLGALILSLLVLGIQTLTAIFFNLKGYSYFLSFLVPLSLMFAIPQVNYYLFAAFDISFLFSSIVGFFCVLAASVVFLKISRPWCRLAYWFLAFCVCYPFFGFYSLFGGVLCLLKEWILADDAKRRFRCEIMLLGVLVTPLCWFPCYAASHAFSWFYVAGLFEESVVDKDLLTQILFYGSFWSCFFWLGLPGVCELGAFAFRGRPNSSNIKPQADLPQKPKPPIWGVQETVLTLFVSLLCCGMVYKTFHQQDFMVLLKAGSLLERNAWEEILAAEAEVPDPINPLISLRVLALTKTGQLPDRIFERPVHPRTTIPLRFLGSFRMLGDRILLQYGYFNIANRCAMNNFSDKKERSLWTTKTLALCALGNDEQRLAKKYLYRIEKTLFHRAWAKRYLDYLHYRDAPVAEQPDAVRDAVYDTAEELQTLRDIGVREDYISDVKAVDYVVYMAFQSQDFKNRPLRQRETQLAFLMFLLDYPRFFENLDGYVKDLHGKPLPPHFQEAILFYFRYVNPGEKDRLKSYDISPEIRQRFERLAAMIQKVQHQPNRDERIAAILNRDFQNTFWHHEVTARTIVNY